MQVSGLRNDIVVSGRVTIEAQLLRKCLSIDCPIDHARGWTFEPTHAMDERDTINAVYVIEVTAFMHDSGLVDIDRDEEVRTLYGRLFSATHAGNYRIIQAEWKVS